MMDKDTSDYTIGDDGVNGWRVWWLGPDGATRERDGFASREKAEEWVEFMESLVA